jgi:hypothetical protein
MQCGSLAVVHRVGRHPGLQEGFECDKVSFGGAATDCVLQIGFAFRAYHSTGKHEVFDDVLVPASDCISQRLTSPHITQVQLCSLGNQVLCQANVSMNACKVKKAPLIFIEGIH